MDYTTEPVDAVDASDVSVAVDAAGPFDASGVAAGAGGLPPSRPGVGGSGELTWTGQVTHPGRGGGDTFVHCLDAAARPCLLRLDEDLAEALADMLGDPPDPDEVAAENDDTIPETGPVGLSDLAAAARVVLGEADTGRVDWLKVDPVRDDSGLISYSSAARVTFTDGSSGRLDLSGTGFADLLEQYADQEICRGLPSVILAIWQRDTSPLEHPVPAAPATVPPER
ncbi:hypothetical protein [Streptomyces sp. NBC_00470]|uniref:hypothetical protein n=1 Tax=Streptomyces sp. NBC_00470 TaxID=2975753 RepID=UPI002F90EF15